MTALDLLATGQAWASAAAEAEHHAPSITDLGWPLANFIIYAFIIIKFAVPLARDFLKTRHEEVLAAVTQAAARKQAAETSVSEYNAKLAGLDKEAQSIHSSLQEEGEREKSKLISEAHTMALKIKEDANFLADQEVKIARQKMREEMANQAATTARELVQRNVSSADQSRLVAEFIQTIGSAS